MTEQDIIIRIRTLCEARNWTIYRLAKESGITYSTLCTLLNKSTAPSMGTLGKICDGFGISPKQFFDTDDATALLTPEQKKTYGKLEPPFTSKSAGRGQIHCLPLARSRGTHQINHQCRLKTDEAAFILFKFRFDGLFEKQSVILSEQSESKDLVICGDRKMVDPSTPLRSGRDDSVVRDLQQTDKHEFRLSVLVRMCI